MKWLRIILPIFLIMGMLLCINSVAYADPGDDPPPSGNPGDGGNPSDGSGLNVNITVGGDNANVGVNVPGENSEVTVNTGGTEVWINGQNLNEPTVIRQVVGGGGVSGSWVIRNINEALDPVQSWAEEMAARLGLTMDGLAKVILLAQDNESQISSLMESFDSQGEIASLRESASEQRMSTLESQQAQIQAQITALEDSYNRILAIIIGAFSLVVIGLGAGLFLLWRRTHGARDYIHRA